MSINSVGIRQEVGRINQVGLDCSLQLGLWSGTVWLGLGLFRHNYAAGDSPLLGIALKDVCSLRVCKAGLRLSHTHCRQRRQAWVWMCIIFYFCVCASWCAVFELAHLPLTKPPSSSCLTVLNLMSWATWMCMCVFLCVYLCGWGVSSSCSHMACN